MIPHAVSAYRAAATPTLDGSATAVGYHPALRWQAAVRDTAIVGTGLKAQVSNGDNDYACARIVVVGDVQTVVPAPKS